MLDGRRAAAQVEEDVVDGPSNAADHLRFLARGRLVMHPTNGPGAPVVGQAALLQPRRKPALAEFRRAPQARKEAPIVLVLIRLEPPGVLAGQWLERHARTTRG